MALLSIDQVRAALGGVGKRTFLEILARGDFPPADTKVGCRDRWHRDTVNDWINARCKRAPAAPH